MSEEVQFTQAEVSTSSLPPEPLYEEKSRLVVPALLFLLTILTTMAAGFLLHVGFLSSRGEAAGDPLIRVLTHPMQLLYGLPFCFTILSILLGHEMGHYLMCRRYGIRSTLPYVIPAPPPFNPFGTFGAVIRIRSNFRDRRQLFDVGIAGPLAGFVLIIPALIVGLSNSAEFVMTDSLQDALEFGEPLLFKLAGSLFYTAGDGSHISLHPVGWAAWFGMLATGINLLPIGQLDGGHVVYALFGPRGHRIASILTFFTLVGLSFYSWPMMGYLLFALVLVFLGFRHPSVSVEPIPLDRKRIIIALLGLVIFVITFIPIPVRLIEHFGRL